MTKALSALLAGLALCASTSGQAAAATPACITAAEMHGLVAYVLPDVLAQATNQCSAYLPPDSYLESGLPKLSAELVEGRTAAWPAAKSAFLKFGNPSESKDAANLPDEALRPLVDATISAKFNFAVNAAACADANDIAEALAPLSADASVHLIATIFNTVARKDNTMRSCPRAAR